MYRTFLFLEDDVDFSKIFLTGFLMLSNTALPCPLEGERT